MLRFLFGRSRAGNAEDKYYVNSLLAPKWMKLFSCKECLVDSNSPGADEHEFLGCAKSIPFRLMAKDFGSNVRPGSEFHFQRNGYSVWKFLIKLNQGADWLFDCLWPSIVVHWISYHIDVSITLSPAHQIRQLLYVWPHAWKLLAIRQ